MSTSIKMISTEDSDKSVFITFDSDWENAKFYFDGKLVQEFSNSKGLINGVQFDVEGLGNVEFKIDSSTFSPMLFVDSEIYLGENPEIKLNKRTTGALIVFGLLVLLNFIMFIFALSNLNAPLNPEFSLFIAILFGFFTAAYLTCFVFLLRGVYIFYFIGLGLFTFTTLFAAVSVSQSQEIDSSFVPAIFPRLIIIGILLIYFKRVAGFMRNKKPDSNLEILDKNF